MTKKAVGRFLWTYDNPNPNPNTEKIILKKHMNQTLSLLKISQR